MAFQRSATEPGSFQGSSHEPWAREEVTEATAGDRAMEVSQQAPPPKPGSPAYFAYLMEQAGITPVDVVATLGRNLHATKAVFDSEGNFHEVEDGPTQVHAANIMLKGMRVLTGGDVNVVNMDGGGKNVITFALDLNEDPEEDDPNVIDGEFEEVK